MRGLVIHCRGQQLDLPSYVEVFSSTDDFISDLRGNIAGLVVIHASNPEFQEEDDRLESFTARVCESGAALVISGSGGLGWARPLDHALRQRGIPSTRLRVWSPYDDRLSIVDWERLRGTVWHEEWDVGAVVKTPEPSHELLPAFAVLCQGYAAAHAEFDNGVWGPTELADTLRRMGWIAFAASEEASGLVQEVQSQRALVRTSRWWCEGVGNAREVRGDAGGESLDAGLADQAKREFGGVWSEEEGLGALVKCLCEGRDVKPDIVAGAYDALGRKLTGAKWDVE